MPFILPSVKSSWQDGWWRNVEIKLEQNPAPWKSRKIKHALIFVRIWFLVFQLRFPLSLIPFSAGPEPSMWYFWLWLCVTLSTINEKLKIAKIFGNIPGFARQEKELAENRVHAMQGTKVFSLAFIGRAYICWNRCTERGQWSDDTSIRNLIFPVQTHPWVRRRNGHNHK